MRRSPSSRWRPWRLALLVPFLGLVGCSAVRQVEIRTEPPGAFVFVNGVEKGISNTRVSLDFSKGPVAFVQVLLEGYRPLLHRFHVEELPRSGRKTLPLQPLN